ncbi:MAG: hypothetical protein AAF581_04040 [Planctomycetota bacterium]
MFLAITLACSLLLNGADGDASEFDWKKPEATEQYEQAKKQFDEGSYQAAGKAFSALRKLAKGKKTKKHVELYRRACEGGIKLGVYEAKASKGGASKAYADAEKASAKYDGTPISKKYRSFLLKMRDELFTPVENFDRSSSRYSPDYGKTFIDEKKWVKQGKQSLRWEVSGKNISLKVKGSKLPKDFSKYKAISMWVCFPKKSATYSLAFRCKGSSKQQMAMFHNAFVKTMKAHKGWKRIEVPLKEFGQQGKASWSDVKDFRIEFQSAPNLTMYLDDISMVKK